RAVAVGEGRKSPGSGHRWLSALVIEMKGPHSPSKALGGYHIVPISRRRQYSGAKSFPGRQDRAAIACAGSGVGCRVTRSVQILCICINLMRCSMRDSLTQGVKAQAFLRGKLFSCRSTMFGEGL